MEAHAASARQRLYRPSGMGALWALLAALVVFYALHQNFGFGGESWDDFFNHWLNGALLWSAAVLCLIGALRASRSRTAWILVALALACWAAGDTIWSIRFGESANPPLITISDALWLAWYPLIVAALTLLVRDRVPSFELHRWIDGVVVMLILATPWVALFLQPVAEESTASGVADAIDFAYPLGDAVIVGATLGVFALMGWRPGRMWLALGLGLTLMGVADAVYSVETLGFAYQQNGLYDAAAAGGAILIAYAAWMPHPGRIEPREVSGWSAIALPLAAQAFAASLQIYGFFYEIPRAERVLTLIVLLIAMVQIVMTRPRGKSPARPPPGG